jgi:hypothetical protein
MRRALEIFFFFILLWRAQQNFPTGEKGKLRYKLDDVDVNFFKRLYIYIPKIKRVVTVGRPKRTMYAIVSARIGKI